MSDSSSKKPKTRTQHKRPVHRKETGPGTRLLRQLPPWVWRLAVALLIVGMVWVLYIVVASPFGLRWKVMFGNMDVPKGYDIHGIDVSHYQGEIDWRLLRDHGTIDECPVSFVMIKATEGADWVDEKFEYNFYQAREYGFKRGAYHYFSTRSKAAEQARFFFKNVELERGDLPPVLDVEQKPKTQTNEEFRKSVLTWLRMAEQHYGVKPILYTYYKFKVDYLNDSVFNTYPYWIAHYYVDSVEYKGAWKFWQHTDVGRLPGIKGNVDLNIYNGSFYDLSHMTIR